MSAAKKLSGRRLREHALWRDATDAVFLLSKQRRLRDANAAWEKLTGLTLAEVRGQPCRRRSARSEPAEHILAALAPPPEALAGQPCTIRRRAPLGGGSVVWWDIAFFPWSDAAGPMGILGKITPMATQLAPHAALPEKLMQLRQRAQAEYRLEHLAGTGPRLGRVAEQVRLAASTDLPVWIEGPPGSGKEWVARTIHQASPRRETYFAVAAAGRMPAGMLTELLHEAGRRWQVGAVYLDQPERLPGEIQTLLLQVLDADGEKPRLFFGSTHNAGARGVQPELYGRCSALTIELPALADRLDDLPLLVERLAPRAARAAGKRGGSVSAEALALLRQHRWPGNLTELYDVLLGAFGRATAERLQPADLPFYVQQTLPPPEPPLPLDQVLEKVERRLIELALHVSQGNKTRAAEMLAIWRPRLLRRMEQFGMSDAASGDAASSDQPE